MMILIDYFAILMLIFSLIISRASYTRCCYDADMLPHLPTPSPAARRGRRAQAYVAGAGARVSVGACRRQLHIGEAMEVSECQECATRDMVLWRYARARRGCERSARAARYRRGAAAKPCRCVICRAALHTGRGAREERGSAVAERAGVQAQRQERVRRGVMRRWGKSGSRYAAARVFLLPHPAPMLFDFLRCRYRIY